MAMKTILNEVEKLTEMELELANKEYPPFSSAHEEFGVMLEERDELTDQVKNVKDGMRVMWKHIKTDQTDEAIDYSMYVQQEAEKAAAEAIQVAAMAKKFRESI